MLTHLLCGFEDVTSEDIGGGVPGDVGEYFEILGVMRDVEDPVDGVTHDQKLVLVQVCLLLLGETIFVTSSVNGMPVSTPDIWLESQNIILIRS